MESDRTLFKCTQCGDCCKGYGGTYLTEADIDRISAFIGEGSADFKQKYCVLSGNRPVLAQQSNGYCIFFERNCSIHAVKPRMCRKWPFIDSLKIDIGNWRIMARFCPGMNTNLDDRQLTAAIHRKMEE